MSRREVEVVLYNMNVIFVQLLCTMLSVYRKTTELAALSESSVGFIVPARNSEILAPQVVNNDWEITPKLCFMYAELIRLTVWCMYFLYLFLWRYGPTWSMAYSLARFLDHTQRRITVGRTPLDE